MWSLGVRVNAVSAGKVTEILIRKPEFIARQIDDDPTTVKVIEPAVVQTQWCAEGDEFIAHSVLCRYRCQFLIPIFGFVRDVIELIY